MRLQIQCEICALVLCLLNGWCFAARDFRSRRGASDEHIPKWICKERATKPGPKGPAALRVAPRFACGFVARRSQPHFGGCSLLAPRHRPTWGQPEGRQVFSVQASLLAPYSSTSGYARRSRLAWTENPLPQNTSYLGDTTPAKSRVPLPNCSATMQA